MTAGAIIQGSPIQFKVSDEFADYCLHHVGSVIHHDILGSLFCDEILMNENGRVREIMLVGTSDPFRQKCQYSVAGTDNYKE